MISLLINLTDLYPYLRVTILTIPSFSKLITNQINRSSSKEERLKVISLKTKDEGDFDPRFMKRQAEDFKEVLRGVLEELIFISENLEQREEEKGLENGYGEEGGRNGSKGGGSGSEGLVRGGGSWGRPKVFIYDVRFCFASTTYGSGLTKGGDFRLLGSASSLRLIMFSQSQSPVAALVRVPLLVLTDRRRWLSSLVTSLGRISGFCPQLIRPSSELMMCEKNSCWCSAELGSDLGRAIEYADQLIDDGMGEEEAMIAGWDRKVGYVVRTPGLRPMYDCE